jgi:mutator protein MutT
VQHKPFQFSVKAVVVDNEGRCLVIRRSPESNNNAGLWDLPGGKCDPGETMEVALRREVHEETGLNVRFERVVGSTQYEMSDRIVAYMILEGEAFDGDVQLSSEHDDYQWVSRSELPTLRFPPQFQDFLKSYSQLTQAASAEHSEDWYRDQIKKFREESCNYKCLANTLISVLQDETDALGIHAIVQARAKTIASFAEKIQRPGKNYTDPINELTDLCGARVITHTLSEVKAICNFVEGRFHIDWKDSGDKAEILGASEFGYLSRHYIVSLKPGEFPVDKVPKELVGLGLKAEIQVRTILQHAWADTAHELSYKSSFVLPRRWKREFARLAAVLEEADRGFDAIASGLKEYASSYGSYLERPRLEQELRRRELVKESDPNNEGVSHQLAKLAMTLEDWQRAIEVLRPFASNGTAGLMRDLGVSLCKFRRKEVKQEEFREGQSLLMRATELDPEDADAWASLAGTWRTRESQSSDDEEKRECRQRAKQFYRRAFEVDHTDPFPLGNYIEYEVADNPQLDVASFFGPSLELASKRCLAQVSVEVNLPWAYFDLGKFALLLRRPFEALGYYAQGVDHSPARFQLSSALHSFVTLETAADRLPGFHWLREFLRLANAIRFAEEGESPLLPTPQASKIQSPVVIVAGYCSHAASVEHRTLLVDGLRNFRGTVISGGTAAGISRVVGDLQETYSEELHTIGYTPAHLPEGVELDERYTEHRHTSGDDFSLLEPLQYWADVLDSNVPIDQIRLIVIGGGDISACECQMALALGIRTAVLYESDTTLARVLSDLGWLAHPRLQHDAATVETLRQFIQ